MRKPYPTYMLCRSNRPVSSSSPLESPCNIRLPANDPRANAQHSSTSASGLDRGGTQTRQIIDATPGSSREASPSAPRLACARGRSFFSAQQSRIAERIEKNRSPVAVRQSWRAVLEYLRVGSPVPPWLHRRTRLSPPQGGSLPAKIYGAHIEASTTSRASAS